VAWRLRRPRPFDGFVDRDVGELFERFVGLYIGELLESRGWTRAGLTFAKLNSIGDAVFLNVQLSQSSHGSFIAFFVNENAAPRPWSEFRSGLLNTPVDDWERQSIVGVFWAWRLKAPDDGTSRVDSSSWYVDVSDRSSVQACGTLLHAAVAAASAELEELLDRERLRLRVARDERSVQGLLELILDVDEGRPVETGRLAGVPDDIVQWLAARGLNLVEGP